MLPLLLWWALGPVASAASPDADLRAISVCIDDQDVACAQAILTRLGAPTSDDPNVLAMSALVAFSAGDYPLASDTMKRAVAKGFPDRGGDAALYERTMFATAGWVEAPVGRFRVRYRPGLDALIAPEIGDVLIATDKVVGPLLGEIPPGNSIVELFPDGRSFIAASSLTQDDVQSTGVIALSKWTRLLVTSPRTLGRGYDWRSTLSHEYIHLMVAHDSGNNTPVWLQEGIAKYLEGRWQDPRFQLSAESQAWLAEGLKNKDLVTFEEIRQSIAKIKVFDPDGSINVAASAERAGRAYAQLATLVQFCFSKSDDKVLVRTLAAIKGGKDPEAALATASGFTDFPTLLAAWEAWIRQQPLISRRIAALPTVLDGGNDAALDPSFSKRKDLANKLRLGDLLAEQKRWTAALAEYAQAVDPDMPNAPLLASRVARATASAGNPDAALTRLRASLVDYPDFSPGWRVLGDILSERGIARDAAAAYAHAVSLDPFDITTQAKLRDRYATLGDPRVKQSDLALLMLRRGGEDVERKPIHERSGTYELPRDPAVAEREASSPPPGARIALMGHTAPDFKAATLSGVPISLLEQRGKVVVLDFWATWCGPCVSVMPKLSELQQKERARGLVVIGLTDEPAPTVQRFAEIAAHKGTIFQQTLAVEDGSARRAYGVSSIPMLVVIGRDGTVANVHIGAGDLSEVMATIDQLLGKAAGGAPE